MLGADLIQNILGSFRNYGMNLPKAVLITVDRGIAFEDLKVVVGFKFEIAKELVPWGTWNVSQRVMSMVNMPVLSSRMPHDLSL